MNWMTMAVGTLTFVVIQVSIIKALPRSIVAVISIVPIIGTLINFAASGSIAMFTGTGSYVGVMNMVSSVFVLVWFVGYKSYHKPEIQWKKSWTGIPVPKLVLGNPKDHWLF